MGERITGTFKGPHQSGLLEGTIDGDNIQFHVKTRVPLDDTGTVTSSCSVSGAIPV